EGAPRLTRREACGGGGEQIGADQIVHRGGLGARGTHRRRGPHVLGAGAELERVIAGGDRLGARRGRHDGAATLAWRLGGGGSSEAGEHGAERDGERDGGARKTSSGGTGNRGGRGENA